MEQINIVTNGYVVQSFDIKNNKFLDQYFYGDDTQYEDLDGNPIGFDELSSEVQEALNNEHLPHDLLQPGDILLDKNKIRNINEAIQSDLIVLISSIFAAGTENCSQDDAETTARL